VKLRAAEADLLRVAEKVRDLLNSAVKGDKSLLSQVFGGSCQRFHRFRRVIDTVEFSDMHAKDQRWKHLIEAMETIEEVLKQLGTFKPFQLEKKVAPEISGYTGLRSRFSPGELVQMRPECEGSEAQSFAVEPALPEGLTLDEATGEISGVLKPGTEVPPTNYTLRATNAHGVTDVKLRFAVAEPAPGSLAYASVPRDCFVGELVSWRAEVSGGAPRGWSVEPALPAGLLLDAQTGAIVGTPTAAAEATDYTVTAGNASGEATCGLSFAVRPAPPVSLAYPGALASYSTGAVVYATPEVVLKSSGADARRPTSANWERIRARFLPAGARWHGVVAGVAARAALCNANFSVEPPLPRGLALAAKSGVISGSCTAPSEEATYTITCKNDGGSISTELTFAVKPQAPSSLEYPDLTGSIFIGQPVSLWPEVRGPVDEWTVAPPLPAGLHLDPSVGIVSGIPTEEVAQGSWAVTARNSEGETSSTLTFAVHIAAPSDFSYPGLSEAYPLLRSMALEPIVEGLIDEFSVEPALPAGLQLDPVTGVIHGTPSETTEECAFAVTARNKTGAATACLTFGVRLMPPQSLAYARVDDVYSVGEPVSLEPEVEGGATSWAVEPALPPGLSLDATGRIWGAPETAREEASYVVTATNGAGGTSAVLTFAVTAPRPEGLSYPAARDEYEVGEEVLLEPRLRAGVATGFSVEPGLPQGLALDQATGVISGAPAAEAEPRSFRVTAANASGTAAAELVLGISKASPPAMVDQKFAAYIDDITDLADLMAEPAKTSSMGDWMVWMVHRAWLNDPSLTDFNFSNKWMPPPHCEPRIAPKLMTAMAHNTHIVSLQLANSNMMKPQGHELAEALKRNSTLQVLNIETNSLDSDGLRHLAAAILESRASALEQVRFNNQKSLGSFFGRPVEQAFAELAERSERILKLGFSCNDAHWRLTIDRALLRNNDLARRRRKCGAAAEPEEVLPQERSLGRLALLSPPTRAAWEVFDEEDERSTLIRQLTADSRRLPTKEQVQSFARSQGKPIPYSAVATVFKAFRERLVAAAVNGQVAVADVYGADAVGCLHAWAEKNEHWSLDVWMPENTRYNCVSSKQPAIELSEDFAAWLRPSK